MAEDTPNTITAEQRESAQVLDDLTSLSRRDGVETAQNNAIENAGRIESADHSDLANLQPNHTNFESPARHLDQNAPRGQGVDVVPDRPEPIPTVPPITNPVGGRAEPVPPPPTGIPEYEPIHFPLPNFATPEGRPVAPERVEPTPLPAAHPDVTPAPGPVRVAPAATQPPVTNPPTEAPTPAPTPEP
ncbi:MAG: hypothetical protein HQL66_09145, partial [Magnetococcales bacterium]|nr:hypothetical protein [Magnetococcales bacterium]